MSYLIITADWKPEGGKTKVSGSIEYCNVQLSGLGAAAEVLIRPATTLKTFRNHRPDLLT